MPLGLRLPSGVRGDWGLESVPDDVDERSLVTTVSSQPLSVSPEMERMEWCVKVKRNMTFKTSSPGQGHPSVGVGKSMLCLQSRKLHLYQQGAEAHSRLSLRTGQVKVPNQGELMSSSVIGSGVQVLAGNSNKELPPSPKGDAGMQAGGGHG